MIEVYQEDKWTQSHRIGAPDEYLMGIGLQSVSRVYLDGYSSNLRAWGYYPVYEDYARASTYYTKGKSRAFILTRLKHLERAYWRYFLRWLLCKNLRLIRVETGEMFTWQYNFRPFRYVRDLTVNDTWLRI